MIVSNSSPIIIFANIDRLYILKKLFGEVYVPKAVYHEITAKRSKIENLEWVKVKDIQNRELSAFIANFTGSGEAEAIVLSKELNSKLLIDDLEGRKFANLLKIDVIGSLGLLKIAKKNKIIDSVNEIISDMLGRGFYIDEGLIKTLLEDVGEV